MVLRSAIQKSVLITFGVICVLALNCTIISCCQAKAKIVSSVDVLDDDTCAIDTIEGEVYGDEESYEYDPDFDDKYEVTSVVGLPFGVSRSFALSTLHSRFGYEDRDEGNCVTFSDNVSVGGISYSYARFFFYDDKLVAASLVKFFSVNNFQMARNFRDKIAKQYQMKYKNLKSHVDKNGFKNYVGGKLDFIWYPINIFISKEKGMDGIMRYYVTVNYFSHRISSALNEDI